MEPHESEHLFVEEKKAFFRKATITHRLLEQTHRTIVRAVREPAGFAFLLVYGPTGVGKTRMIEAPPKRRPLRGKAAESDDLPELKEATKDVMRRHGVRVVILDEAHHILYEGNGMAGSTLQEQLEWLKSLSSTTGALYILVGTYDLFNFGKLNGQISRRCLPVHFPWYQLQREEDCIEFQAALLALLHIVPLNCDATTFVTSHWLYFYECSIGCIGVLKDWLLRAVSTALDEGQETLTLDWIQDHAPPVDIYRQMALDATEGEEKLNHMASNREHVWRLLQGGELIAPVPPLPPRETSTLPSSHLCLPRYRQRRAAGPRLSVSQHMSQMSRSQKAKRPDHARRSKRLQENRNREARFWHLKAQQKSPYRQNVDGERRPQSQLWNRLARRSRSHPRLSTTRHRCRLILNRSVHPPSPNELGALGNQSPNGMLLGNQR